MPKDFKMAICFLTRACAYQCEYCQIAKTPTSRKALTTEQWVEATRILKSNGVDFNLILGNDPWLLGVDNLKKILFTHKIPYALYTACNPNVFRDMCDPIFQAGIDSIACGIDTLKTRFEQCSSHMECKAYYALEAFERVKRDYPHVDCQATCTIGAYNVSQVLMLIKHLNQKLKCICALSMLHADIDGGFDFCTPLSVMKDLGYMIDTSYKFGLLEHLLDDLFVMLHRNKAHLVHNLEEFVTLPMVYGKTGVTNDLWNCEGLTFSAPTIDADGSLRVCALRKGRECPEMTVFDLDKADGWAEWQRRARKDAAKCPGCLWSCARMQHFLRSKGDASKAVINHAISSSDMGRDGVKRRISK